MQDDITCYHDILLIEVRMFHLDNSISGQLAIIIDWFPRMQKLAIMQEHGRGPTGVFLNFTTLVHATCVRGVVCLWPLTYRHQLCVVKTACNAVSKSDMFWNPQTTGSPLYNLDQQLFVDCADI